MSENENTEAQGAETGQEAQTVEEAAAAQVLSGDPLPPAQQNFAEQAPSEIAPEPTEMDMPALVAEFKYLLTRVDALQARVDNLCTQLNVKS